MASSGVIYGSRAVNSYGPRIELHWSQVSQDIVANTTKIKINTYFDVQGTIQYSGYNYVGSTTAGGTTQSYTYPGGTSTTKRRLLGTTYHTLKHNENGSLTATISGYYPVKITWNGTYVASISASGSITLNTITRGINQTSVSLASGWSTVTGAKTVTFSKYSSLATVRLEWDFWNATGNGWSNRRVVSTNYASGTSFSISAADINTIHTCNPNTKTVTCRVFLLVYQGSSLIQTISKNVTLTLKVEAPSVSATVTVTGKNQSLLGNALYAVQGIHSAVIKASATAKNGATIKSYNIIFQGQTFQSQNTTQLIKNSGSLPIQVKAVDSRGFQYTATVKTIVSRAYSQPKINNHRAFRQLGSVENPIGTTGRVTGTVGITNVLNASGANCNAAYWKISLDSTNTYNSTNITYSRTLAIESSLNYTITFGDKFSDLSIKGTIPSGQAPLVLGKKSVGVNTVPGLNQEGLFIKDDLINGQKVALIYDLYADHSVVGNNNYIEAVKSNWSKIREGISFAECRVASRGMALIIKYPQSAGNYGVVTTFGYGGGFRRFILSLGTWKEV